MGAQCFKAADHPIGWWIFLLDHSIWWCLLMEHRGGLTASGPKQPFRVTSRHNWVVVVDGMPSTVDKRSGKHALSRRAEFR
jgi:hypothetical protein